MNFKYKLPQSGSDLNVLNSQYKYDECNVQQLALVATAQECAEIESRLDDSRLDSVIVEISTDKKDAVNKLRLSWAKLSKAGTEMGKNW